MVWHLAQVNGRRGSRGTRGDGRPAATAKGKALGHTFDSTDHDFLFGYESAEQGETERDARWLERHTGQTPLTFPFPMQTPAIPLDEPGSDGSRRAG